MLKENRLNRNSIPFLILGIIHLFILVKLINQQRHRLTFILLLTNIGLAYMFEYFVLNLFQAYTYKPRVMKQRNFDNIFGAILSQALFVPVTATYLTLSQKNWKWKLAFSSGYYFIEKLFLRLQIYKVHWWKPLYTFLLINVYFIISDCFYQSIMNRKKWALKTAHYLSIEVIYITLMYVAAARRRIRFGRGYVHSWREHFIIAPLYSFLFSAMACLTSVKSGLHYRLLLLFGNVVMDLVLVRAGVLKLHFQYYIRILLSQFLMSILSRSLYNLIYKQNDANIH
ncbi:hypothetical protein [Ammoniphilus sp. CFH 90114]|uniref:hypothetical protein n=1 Tax=Ammoniphilus sp. CFH 90114 TaxID=2493665 RepID=UPI001010050A|nr:hypothetical protein [Ammoniphilus sp. CFH 90114]RXT03737.1 hypothetical protein EIZ39_23135 [Ammoniphilus sp. CFH 90114]